MKEEFVKNLSYLKDGEEFIIDDLLNNNYDLNDYIETNYYNIMNRWKNEFSMFNIPSGMVSISINDETIFLNLGEGKYNKDTIFDIASMSKFYTECILLDFIKDYNISLDSKIKDISSNYSRIGDLTIMDLISFNNTYKTDVDVRKCTNRGDAIKALRTSYIEKDKQGYYLYTDPPIMILSDILEEVSGLSYKELFNKYIIQKYDLKDTYLDIDKDNDRYLTVNKGFVNDPKANIMGGYHGHAGVKTTSEEFIKFFSKAFDNDYNYLFTGKSNCLNKEGKRCLNKALIGNLNLGVKEGDTLACDYITERGFAIQGSVRCHAESMVFNIDDKEYKVSSSIFLDLYTMVDSIREYEKKSGKTLINEYDTENGHFITTDVRSILPYTSYYKEITNLVGIIRLMALKKHILEREEDINKSKH